MSREWWLRPAVAWAATCLFATAPTRAFASDCKQAFAGGAFACVKAVLEPTPDTGAWDDAAGPSHALSIIHAGKRLSPVRVGTALSEGDVVRTARARVAIELRAGGLVRLSDETELEVGNFFEQIIGNVWYQLRTRTSVRYGALEAAIEGTEFWVYDLDRPAIAVKHGAVLVRAGDSARRVESDERVVLVHGKDLSEVREWSQYDQYHLSRLMWRAGHPRVVLGISGGLGTAGRRFAPQARANVLFRVGAQLGLSGEAGVSQWGVTVSGAEGLRVLVAGGPRWYIKKLPPPENASENWNDFVWHHASLGADVVAVYAPLAKSQPRPTWGGALSYDFAFPFRGRLVALVQARLGMLQDFRVFWNFSYGIGIAL